MISFISAKAACTEAKRVADAVVERYNDCPIISAIHSASRGSAENTIHKMSSKHELRINVVISYVDMPGIKRFPHILFSSWVKYLVKKNLLHLLTGGHGMEKGREHCKQYWERWCQIFPEHTNSEKIRNGVLPPEYTIPVQTHQDEGRGFGRSGVLIGNTGGCIGKLARMTLKHHMESGQAGPGMGHSLLSRFLYCVAPKSLYSANTAFYKELWRIYKEDLAVLANEGFEFNGTRYFVAWQGTKGDLPALASIGGLNRTFRSVAKRPNAKTVVMNGICHWCDGGTHENLPWEDVSLDALWVGTMGLNPAWDTFPEILELGHDRSNPGMAFLFDIWHNLHLGDAKTIFGSGYVLCLDLIAETSVDRKMEELNLDLGAYLSVTKQRVQCVPITRDKLSWTAAADFPQMTWQKGQDAVVLLAWLENYFRRHEPMWADLEVAALFDSVFLLVRSINEFCRIMYSEPLWIEDAAAERFTSAGLIFLTEYRRCVYLSHRANKKLFFLQPKIHYIAHTIFEAHRQTSALGFCLNPLGQSCQMDEDFVGRPCRLSRRVSSRVLSTCTRSIERYLILTHSVWKDHGVI